MACLLSGGWRARAVDKEPQPGPHLASAGAGLFAVTNHLVPGANDGKIAYVAARLLEQNQFLRHPLDDGFSEQFYYRYLETLDPQRMHFTEGDLAAFDTYRTNLDDLTLNRRGVADTTPAYRIFDRFLERLEQHVNYVEELLKNEKFEFNTDERVLLNRKDAPYPRDLDEAKQLWRQRLRFEYLQEKLARTARTNSVASEAAKPGATNNIIVETLSKSYNRTWRRYKELDNDDLLEVYLTALARVYDPHSDYMGPRQAENFSIGMSLALFGIGAELRSEDGYCKIGTLLSGPAMKSKKIKVGDRIVAVAQSNAPPVDIVDMPLPKAVGLIRGPKGTEVRLTIIPADAMDSSTREVVSLIRDEIKLENGEAKAKVIDLPGNSGKTLQLGVIDLPSFYATLDLGGSRRPMLAGEGGDSTKATPRSTSADVAKLLTKLKQEHIDGVILDLRRNGGGSLEEAVKLTGLFIKEGPVVQVRGPDGEPFVDEDTDPSIAYDGPLIVLTSRFSASASEILAGALQDYGRALIVGDVSTHGKGTVQNLNPLRMWIKPSATFTNDPGALKVTIRKFYRAGGASTQKKGVLPDIVLPSVLNYSKDIGEAALENSLDWDSIPSARFDKLNLVEPCLPELLQRSCERVAHNQDFDYVREDIELYKKRQTDKTVSLNEQVRRKEKEEDDARQKARDKERLARKEPDQKVRELTLAQVDLPGLPPPIVKTNMAAAKSAHFEGTPGAVTNAAALSVKSTLPLDASDDEDAAEKPAAIDATLQEAEQILVDYIRLLASKGMLTAQHAVIPTP